jgi:hypothetical protein
MFNPPWHHTQHMGQTHTHKSGVCVCCSAAMCFLKPSSTGQTASAAPTGNEDEELPQQAATDNHRARQSHRNKMRQNSKSSLVLQKYMTPSQRSARDGTWGASSRSSPQMTASVPVKFPKARSAAGGGGGGDSVFHHPHC